MIKDIITNVVSDLGLKAVLTALTNIHDTNKLKNDIIAFANREFEARYSHLCYNSEIDFGGLEVYLSDTLIKDVRIYLFATNQSIRKRCFDSIIEISCHHATANNKAKQEEIERFTKTVLSITKEYFVGKLDGEYLLLQNITIEAISETIADATNVVLSEIKSSETRLLEAIINEQFDIGEVVKAVNDSLDDGNFKVVNAILKAINKKSKSIILFIKIKLSCFNGDKGQSIYISEFVKLKPDVKLADDLISFLCLYVRDKSILNQLIPICGDSTIIEIARFMVEDKIPNIYTREVVEDSLHFKILNEYANNAVALKLFAIYIIKNENIINKQDIYKVLESEPYNFYMSFKSLSFQTTEILSVENLNYNSKYRKLLEILFNSLLILEKSFKQCSVDYQIEYFRAVLPIISYLQSENTCEYFDKLPLDCVYTKHLMF